jgi:hypothetical protein
MPAAPPNIPQYRERVALQALLHGSWASARALHPAGAATIARLIKKCWIEEKVDAAAGSSQYRITVEGKTALVAKVPTRR